MGDFRQRIEILSLVPLACEHMQLRAWVHNPKCIVPWPGEQTGLPSVNTCSNLDMT
jgi:hypothetical protein